VIAAPGQVDPPDLARVVAESRLAGGQEGRGVMRRAAGPVLLDEGAGAESLARRTEFTGPTAVEGHEVVAWRRQRADADPVQAERARAGIGHTRAKADDPRGRIHDQREGHPETSGDVLQVDLAAVRDPPRLAECKLGNECTVGAAAVQGGAAGKPSPGLGEEIEDLAAIQHAMRNRAVEQAWIDVTFSVRRQPPAPVGDDRRALAQGQDQRVVAAVEPHQIHQLPPALTAPAPQPQSGDEALRRRDIISSWATGRPSAASFSVLSNQTTSVLGDSPRATTRPSAR